MFDNFSGFLNNYHNISPLLKHPLFLMADVFQDEGFSFLFSKPFFSGLLQLCAACPAFVPLGQESLNTRLFLQQGACGRLVSKKEILWSFTQVVNCPREMRSQSRSKHRQRLQLNSYIHHSVVPNLSSLEAKLQHFTSLKENQSNGEQRLGIQVFLTMLTLTSSVEEYPAKVTSKGCETLIHNGEFSGIPLKSQQRVIL